MGIGTLRRYYTQAELGNVEPTPFTADDKPVVNVPDDLMVQRHDVPDHVVTTHLIADLAAKAAATKDDASE